MKTVGRHASGRLLAGALLCAALASVASAHGPLDESLAELSRRIVASPEDGALRLRRGELHRLHEDWSAAIDDFDVAERLLPGAAPVDVCRAQLYLDMGVPDRALRCAERALDGGVQPAGEVRLLRAQALERLGRLVDAAAAYEQALSEVARVRPEDVLVAADCQRRALADGHAADGHAADGRVADERLAAALRCLELGLSRMGACASVELAALDTEVELRRWSAALSRIDRLRAPLARQESWLIRRAEVLERADRIDEARADYEAASRALVELPQAVLRRRQTQRLADTCERALARLVPPGGSP